MITNYFYIVLDASTSMDSIVGPTVDAYNSIADGIRRNAEWRNQRSLVSLRTFSDTPHPAKLFNVPADKIEPLLYGQYRPMGNTQLFGAVKASIEELDPFDSKRANASFTVIPITDGEDNRSYGLTQVCLQMMAAREENWTFAFQIPRGKRDWFARQFNVPHGNINEWEATAAGAARMAVDTQEAIGNYMDERAAGARATKGFFVKPDLSGVNVKRVLDDLAGQFRVLTVGPNPSGMVWQIRDFVEHMGMEFKNGECYYQLMKPEEVQHYKQVLIMEGRKVYGGPEARELIGLPPGQEAKVTPGNHDKYTIFIQSTSHNARKLPHGTKLLVRK